MRRFIIVFLASCTPAPGPSLPPTPTVTATALASATAEAEVAPPAPEPAATDCCKANCTDDEKYAWDRCDGSELAKLIAEEWEAPATGREYDLAAVGNALRGGTVYVADGGPELFECMPGNPQCLVVYTDEKAVTSSCKSNPKPVAFKEIAEQAVAEKRAISVGCIQFFTTVLPEDVGSYVE